MPETVTPTIRLAGPEDAEDLAKLAGQLGYPSTVAQICKRFEMLVERTDENVIFVAESNGDVIGWVHAHIYILLVDDPETEIGGLVVEDKFRGQGIGEK